MMKKYLTLSSCILGFLLISLSTSRADEFRVVSFQALPADPSARDSAIYDMNNEICALLRVRTSITGIIITSPNKPVGQPRYINGEYLVFLSPREKKINLAKEGFLDLPFEFGYPVESARVYYLEIEAIKKGNQIRTEPKDPGWVVINSIPSGAEVIIDGQSSTQTTPLQLKLPAGKHSLKLRMALYHSKDTAFDIYTYRTTRLTDIRLRENYGTLTITSNVTDAEVMIDGEWLDHLTPVTIEKIETGTHIVKLRKEGYREAEMPIVIAVGSNLTESIPLYPDNAMYTISTWPPGTIMIDGDSAGYSVFKGTLNQGLKRIYAYKDKYGSSEIKDVMVEAGISDIVELEIEERYAYIDIQGNPYNASIKVDDIMQHETTPAFLRLKIGNYRLTISHVNYETLDTFIFVSPVNNRTINYQLKRKLLIDGQSFLASGDSTNQTISPGEIGIEKIVQESTSNVSVPAIEVPKDRPQLDFVFVEGQPFHPFYLSGESAGQDLLIHLDDFFISRYEVTNAQFCAYLNSPERPFGDNAIPWIIDLKEGNDNHEQSIYRVNENGQELFKVRPGRENFPVVYVTWQGARMFCLWLGGQLPTEFEWEYAATGGVRNKENYPFSGSFDPATVSWFNSNSYDIAPVGEKEPNQLGIHDMSGNVAEWCNDWHSSRKINYNPEISTVVLNPEGPDRGSRKVIKGGSFLSDIKGLQIGSSRYSEREKSFPDTGFRVKIKAPPSE